MRYRNARALIRSFNSQWDEILRIGRCFATRSRYVSIPNGMKFYFKSSTLKLYFLAFQFPMGWNSTRPVHPAKNITKSFNSQWDEILQYLKQYAISVFVKFQFPMGWNSTSKQQLIKNLIMVSIPNGMKFYSQGLWGMDQNEEVSIPNGMKSYIFSPFLSMTKSIVSIPNGMKFYRIFCVILSIVMKFQFPMGWNSTRIAPLFLFSELKFQFPMGWNSTRLVPCSTRSLSRVSIPNGMKFYLILITIFDEKI